MTRGFRGGCVVRSQQSGRRLEADPSPEPGGRRAASARGLGPLPGPPRSPPGGGSGAKTPGSGTQRPDRAPPGRRNSPDGYPDVPDEAQLSAEAGRGRAAEGLGEERDTNPSSRPERDAGVPAITSAARAGSDAHVAPAAAREAVPAPRRG